MTGTGTKIQKAACQSAYRLTDLLTRPGGTWDGQPALAPDGRTIVDGSAFGRTAVGLWELPAAAARPARPVRGARPVRPVPAGQALAGLRGVTDGALSVSGSAGQR